MPHSLNHYIDITLHPAVDVAPAQAFGDLLSRLHREQAQSGVAGASSCIGISLPRHHGRETGRTLRLHGEAAALADLRLIDELPPLYRASEPRPAPANAPYRCVRRRQAHSSPERMRRRYAHRHGVTLEQARGHLPDTGARRLDLPLLRVPSASTGQVFPLLIEHGPVQSVPADGAVNSYGLGGAVPWF